MPCCAPGPGPNDPGPNGTDPNGLDRLFRGGIVAREKRRLLRSGPEARQRALLDGAPLDGRRLLDVGSGVGAVAFEALARGAADARLVDVSRAYLAAASEVAALRGVSDRVEAMCGDAATLALEPADHVTLDRVVCCYPDAERLLERLANLSREGLAFSYPSPTGWVRLWRTLLNGGMRLVGRRYRFFLHDPARLAAAAGRGGLRPAGERRFGVWRVARFERAR